MSWRSPLPMTSGVTTSATPTPTGTSPPVVASTARATDPTPNHWFAGLSRVHECAAVSASGVPNGRPITAVAVWYTGSPGHGGGEADAQHPVLADRPRQAGAELHPVRAVPQQGLGGDRQVAEREGRDQPRPGGGALRAHGRGRRGSRAGPRSLRGQVPGALAPARVLVVFLLQHQLIARPGQHLPAGSLVEHRAERAAARRVGGHGEELVLDPDAVDVRPARTAD